MRNPWTMKMEQFTRFSPEERHRLAALITERRQQHAQGEDIIREGDHSPECPIVLPGLTTSWSNAQLADGQISWLKMIKRTMYGRPIFAPFRRRILIAA